MSSPSNPRRPRPDGRAPLRAEWDPINSTAATSGENRYRQPRERVYAKQGRLGRLLRTYGWRAYAVPVLAILTVVALVMTFTDTFRTQESTESSTESHLSRNPTPEKTIIGAPTKTVPGPVPPAGMLPEGGAFTEKGQGIWHVVPGATPRVGKKDEGNQQVFTYRIAVEDGVDMSALGGDQAFAAMVDKTLADPRSWIHDPAVAFQRIDKGTPSFTISLTSPMTVRQACGYTIQLESSCYNGEIGRVVINLARWVRGATAFEGDLTGYRQYAINHEVGHAIGYPQHVTCPAQGALAPIMMQQSFGVKNRDIFDLDKSDGFDNDLTCRPNAWVAPVLK
ncbi:hypothetical protein TPB0596_13970 [Tsukamurella pulmonis]|uniref:Peptidase metallopeptidase domain-containing protein n=1 Tax=Tsukamurella pulmonis TaxID=47312 RepID=A0A1H1GS30_9ACTN|nr:DUF3152 domain-containing protein [Tsukamurella pulmonis]KXO88302.1 hypothetical protein AXK56_13205 [Tsukamurella pulmonis]KXP13276.1 hypothetical protein AXK57_03395 [Tsukamurella pulmonis]RDH09795.1 DUF3152 domain-containing protein [Tsukamurella pulmonis]SDR15666.1 Protein of unknown function [Tsukamurella pulmonis]SUP16811.1 Protein of uncharacterised function (DUF3152) [Tsukamurella pulmonis]